MYVCVCVCDNYIKFEQTLRRIFRKIIKKQLNSLEFLCVCVCVCSQQFATKNFYRINRVVDVMKKREGKKAKKSTKEYIMIMQFHLQHPSAADPSSDFSLFTKLDTEHHVDRQRRPHLPNQNYKRQNSSSCLAYLDRSRSY